MTKDNFTRKESQIIYFEQIVTQIFSLSLPLETYNKKERIVI